MVLVKPSTALANPPIANAKPQKSGLNIGSEVRPPRIIKTNDKTTANTSNLSLFLFNQGLKFIALILSNFDLIYDRTTVWIPRNNPRSWLSCTLIGNG